MEFFDYNTYLMSGKQIFNLAQKYDEGNGIDKCAYIAAALYYKSAIKGYTPAEKKVVLMRLLNARDFPSYITLKQNWYVSTLKELETDGKNGDAEAYRLLGYAYLDGCGVDINNKKALEYLQESMNMGSIAAINAIGYMYNYGYGVERNQEIANNYFQIAAEKKNYSAMCNLAREFEKGSRLDNNETMVLELYKNAALNGYAPGQYKYSLMLMRGVGIEKNVNIAFEYCFKAAKQGYKWAQKDLGDKYYEGIGVNKDIREAIFWYCKAAEQEFEDAIYKLQTIINVLEDDDIDDNMRERVALILIRENSFGWPYSYFANIRREPDDVLVDDYGVYLHNDDIIPYIMFTIYMNYDSIKIIKVKDEKQSDKKAVEWLKSGYLTKDASSISLLGECYYNGVPLVDYKKAHAHFLEASQMGFYYATYLLGKLYYGGRGVKVDIDRAISLYTIAAENGVGEACYDLGNLYIKGKVIEKNEDKAFRYFKIVTKENCKKLNYYLSATCNIAYMYQFGISVNHDILQAANLYMESDDEAGTSACNYAWMIHQYELLDKKNAIMWYEKAISKLNTRAMYNLALMYIKGDGVDIDYQKAIVLLKQAVERNNPHAQLIMAIAYKRGFIVKKDKKQAKQLFRIVMKQGKKHKWFTYIEWFFSNRNSIVNASYLPNQLTPEYQVPFSGLEDLTLSRNDIQDTFSDLASYISKIERNDLRYSEKALKLVTNMFAKGVGGAPKSRVLAKYWASYKLDVANDSTQIYEPLKDMETLDIQKELDRKFNEMFGDMEEGVYGDLISKDEKKA